MNQIYFWEVNKNKLFRKSTVSSLTSSRLRSSNLLILQTLSRVGSRLFVIKLIHYGTNSNKVQVWTQICLNLLFLCQTASCQADRSGIQHHIKQAPFKPDASVFPIPSNDLPLPTSSQTSSRQILQLYCPDSRAAGAQATKENTGVQWWRRGWDGKENGQSEDERGKKQSPLPWFNLHERPPIPSPLPPPQFHGSPFCSAALPHARRAQTSGAARSTWVCVASDRSPAEENQQRSSNDFTAVPTEVCRTLACRGPTSTSEMGSRVHFQRDFQRS